MAESPVLHLLLTSFDAPNCAWALESRQLLPLKLAEIQFTLFGLQVIDHYEKPRNVGSFSKLDNSVGTGLVGAPACGDVMKLQIRVRPHTCI